MAPFDGAHTTFYQSAIESVSLSCTNFKEYCDLKITRSHGSVINDVVRATPQVNWNRQTYPSHNTNTP